MSRRRVGLLLMLVVVLATTVLAAQASVARAEVSTAKLRRDLRHARHELREARTRLGAARAALEAALALAAVDQVVPADGSSQPAADPVPEGEAAATPMPEPSTEAGTAPVATPDIAALQAEVKKARRSVRIWRARVTRLAQRLRLRLQIAEWNRRGRWRPLIELAAKRYHVDAGGIYRMMMYESGGRRYAGASSPYKGLFQYWTGTWRASWNPWRQLSIYDGWAQIRATCYAVKRGYGPRMWTSTYARAF